MSPQSRKIIRYLKFRSLMTPFLVAIWIMVWLFKKSFLVLIYILIPIIIAVFINWWALIFIPLYWVVAIKLTDSDALDSEESVEEYLINIKDKEAERHLIRLITIEGWTDENEAIYAWLPGGKNKQSPDLKSYLLSLMNVLEEKYTSIPNDDIFTIAREPIDPTTLSEFGELKNYLFFYEASAKSLNRPPIKEILDDRDTILRKWIEHEESVRINKIKKIKQQVTLALAEQEKIDYQNNRITEIINAFSASSDLSDWREMALQIETEYMKKNSGDFPFILSSVNKQWVVYRGANKIFPS